MHLSLPLGVSGACAPAAEVADPPEADAAGVPPLAPAPLVPSYVSDDEPTEAEFVRGAWRYGRRDATQRGTRVRWYPPSHFLPDQLDSEQFDGLRRAWRAANPLLAAVAAAVLLCENIVRS